MNDPNLAAVEEDGLTARGLAGVKGDLRRRAPHYASDFRDGFHPKVGAAALFMFFACLAPAIAFGGLMSKLTAGEIGVTEMIVATAGCGVVYAIIAGQPLTILGGTGPLLVFTGILYEACHASGIPFLTAYAWIGILSGLLVIGLGLTGASRFVRLFTRFTDETFAALISLIFVVQAVTSLLGAFPNADTADDSALFGLVLGLGTYTVARSLARLRSRPYLRRTVREALADFGPTIAVVTLVMARRLLPGVKVATLDVPTHFGTTSGRPWLVPLGAGPAWLPFAAIVPAMLVAVLVFLDQNVTVRIIQAKENRLQKGAAYHWDLVVVGALLVACSVLGLPWLVAATVRSVSHTRALAKVERREGIEHVTGVIENRLSPLLIHIAVGASLFATGALRLVPMAVLYGLFLYMGVGSMKGNQFFERLRLVVTDPALYPAVHYVRTVPSRTIHVFTAVQAACLAVLWAVKSSPAGLLFPLFIALLVPVRALLARHIPAAQITALDADEAPTEVETDDAGP